jgi:hypothetical protein
VGWRSRGEEEQREVREMNKSVSQCFFFKLSWNPKHGCPLNFIRGIEITQSIDSVCLVSEKKKKHKRRVVCLASNMAGSRMVS